jgi:methionyl aminopeptidase
MELLNKSEQKIITENGKILEEILLQLAEKIEIGVSEKEIENLARELIKKKSGQPAFLNYQSGPGPYPAATCISVNEEIVHSPPADYQFKRGDVISVDLGFLKDKLHVDACFTISLSDDSSDNHLVKATKEALVEAIKESKVGNTTGDIGEAINRTAQRYQLEVIKCLTGHGIGKELHMGPSIYNFGNKGEGEILKPGMAIAIEPILTKGQDQVENYTPGPENDQFSIITKDREKTAHFEDTILITETGPKVLTKQIFYDNVIRDIKTDDKD